MSEPTPPASSHDIREGMQLRGFPISIWKAHEIRQGDFSLLNPAAEAAARQLMQEGFEPVYTTRLEQIFNSVAGHRDQVAAVNDRWEIILLQLEHDGETEAFESVLRREWNPRFDTQVDQAWQRSWALLEEVQLPAERLAHAGWHQAQLAWAVLVGELRLSGLQTGFEAMAHTGFGRHCSKPLDARRVQQQLTEENAGQHKSAGAPWRIYSSARLLLAALRVRRVREGAGRIGGR